MMILATAVDLSVDASLLSFESLSALIALTVMEIVLGIDNIVFIAIITGRLPESIRPFARRVGLFLAMAMRILLLLCIGWLLGLEKTLLELAHFAPTAGMAAHLSEHPEINEISGRDLILLLGGLFLLYTAVREIHHKIESGEEEGDPDNETGLKDGSETSISLSGVLFRIAFMDVIFSLDSVLTAVGMANQIQIMILAVIISVGVMIAFANQISEFVQAHPTVKMLALSFLILISVVLVSDAVGTPISKGYVYFAMAFSLLVEFLNLRMKFKRIRPDLGEAGIGGSTSQSS